MDKILIISYEFPPMVGGAGSVAYDIATNLKKDYNITLITEYVNSGESEARKKLGIDIVEVCSKSGTRPLTYWKEVAVAVTENEYKKIIINDGRSALMASYFFSKKLLKKTIVYLHGREPEEFLMDPSTKLKITLFPFFYKRMLNNCHSIVAVSKYMKEKIVGTKAIKDETKIKVVYNGIDRKIFYKKDSKELLPYFEKYDIPRDKTILISVSRVVKEKGYLEMLGEFKKVVDENSNFHWVIVGSGGLLDDLKNLARDRGLNEYITFVGPVPREELPYFYSLGDLFYLLSNFNESLGLTYLESRFCGTPGLAYNKSGERETIIQGKTGFLIDGLDEGSKIILKRDYTAFKDVSEYVEDFSIEDNMAGIKEVIEG